MPARARLSIAILVCAGCGSSPNNPPDASTAHDASDARVTSDGADGASDGDGGAAISLTASVVTTIALPGVPVVAAYNGGTKKAYFACITGAKASAGIAVVDDTMNEVVGTITSAAVVTSLAANGVTKIVYAAEGAQIDVIDSATDTISTTVKTPDGSPIAGLAVDELHNRTYVVTTSQFMTELFALDGATNMLMTLRNPLLTPTGTPPIAVDGPMQEVFVLGVDSNSAGEIITLDGPTGTPTLLTTTDSVVDPSVSGIVPLGNGTAGVLVVSPGLVKRLEHKDAVLPTTFTPAGVTQADFGRGAMTVVVGFGAAGALQGFGVDTASGTLSPFDVPVSGGLPPGTTAARLLTAAAIAGGAELYLDPTPDPTSEAAFAPTETIKLTVSAAP